ncbi:methyltransferase [Alienimonas chondri]|uniref:Ribosomal RNA small subunit methyltransferase C n=1 Tax=Alienimonas chondri TaxID=2681879 RepID=A0ABX1VG21_9PLAN|nr:methyltransferase [Alienimonas chondri]NNJ26793.1 Ribosomal RNA small subunit methyltransferase C [Alienimonas chondri]
MRAPDSEQLLVENLPDEAVGTALCTTRARGQLAGLIAARWPESRVVCCTLDAYHAQETVAVQGSYDGRLDTVCVPDFPLSPGDSGEEESGGVMDSRDAGYDLAALPTTAGGESELTRELLREAHNRLRIGGRLLVSVDNAKDSWTHDRMRELFSKVTVIPDENPTGGKSRGIVYGGTKDAPLRKQKDFSCEFAFRDRGTLLKSLSRPGVFSHRRIDPGGRALIEAMEPADGDRVLDLGCGSGVVSLAAAARGPSVTVHGVDSNPRAVECTLRGAELNGFADRVSASLTADALPPAEMLGTFDLAVGNPPYFSHQRIAGLFLAAADAALKPGGAVLMVTKQPGWFLEAMGERFDLIQSAEVRRYHVVVGVKR